MPNNNLLFWMFLCGHLVGDFYLQPQSLANQKKKKTRYLLLHSLIYFASILFFILPVTNVKIFFTSILIFITHFIIDFIKIKIKSSLKPCNFLNRNAFCIDQMIHIAIILLMVYLHTIDNIVAPNYIGNKLYPIYDSLQLNIPYIQFIKYVFVILLIGRPSNILINEINKKENIKKSCDNKDTIEKKEPEYENAGHLIGFIERVIVVIMIVLKQYSSLGLIFTAKSITRYDKISKEPAFAEYYLVGTLLSLLIALLSGILICL